MAQRVIGALLLAVLASALGWCGWRHVARGLGYRRDLATVRHADAALADGRPVAALQLLAGAGEAGQERLGRLIVASHTPERWPGLVNAARAAGQDAREALASLLRRSPEENLCAAEALAALGDPRGVQTLGRALVQPPADAHDPADVASLGPPGTQALLNIARFGPPSADKRAVVLLGNADTPGAEHALLGLVSDCRFGQRAEALRAVCQGHRAPPQAEFAELLTDRDPAFRAEAAYQYGAVVGAPALPALREALRDPDPAVRAAVVEATSLIDGPRADALLIRALRDPEPRIVRRAVNALGCRRCLAAEGPLARLYRRATPDLQRDVITALDWIGSPLASEYTRLWQRETGQTFNASSGPSG
jgi:hypothetical protein